MSLDKAIKRTNEVRRARGSAEGLRVTVLLKRNITGGFIFPSWVVYVFISDGENDSRHFWRRGSADRHFERLVNVYELKEV